MKKVLLSAIVLLSACSSGGSAIAMGSFYEVPIGATKPEVISSMGEPYSVRETAEGTVEMEYIERIKEGGRNLEVRYFILTLKDGKVVSKRVKQTSPGPYLFDSYQMQTTQRDADAPASDSDSAN